MTMTRRKFGGLVAGAGLMTGGLMMPARADTTTLRMNNWLPPTHSMIKGVFEPWIAAVEKATNGQVEIQMTDASLGAPPRQYDLAIDGIADITFGVVGYTPGRFTLPRIAELPQVGSKGEALSVALWQVYEKMFAKVGEFDEVKLLGLFTNGTGVVMTTQNTGPITSLADYEGRKFRVGGGVVQQINQMLGGVNVAAPAGEVYEILQQGVADGTLLPADAYPSFDLSGIIANATRVPGGFYTSSWFLAMNQASWDGLSEDVQQAILSVSGEHFAQLAGAAQDAGDVAGLEKMDADGVKTIEADESFVSAMTDRLAPIEAEWIAAAEEKGVDGKAALAMFREITEKLESA